MAHRQKPAPALLLVFALAVVLAVGLAGSFLWDGLGTGERLREDATGGSQAAGSADGTSSLVGDAGKTGTGETRRRNIESAPDPSGTPRGERGERGEQVELTGRLVRSDGTPGAGLTLRYLQLDRRELLRGGKVPSPRDAPAIRTGSDGRFRLQARAGARGYLRLDGTGVVFRKGSGRGMVVRTGKASRDLGDLLILRSARVSGQVVDASGRPVAGVSVLAADGGSSAWTLSVGEGSETGEDGRFDLGGLRPGRQELLTRSPEHLPAEQEVELAEGEHRQDVVIRVQPGGFILGMVVDDLGQPVPGAEVAASRTRRVDTQIKISAFSPGETAHTDEAGRFRLANLSTRKATLRVTKTGLATRTVPDVAVGATDLVVELQRLGAIEGVVVDERNRPVQDSTVSASAGRRMFPAAIRRSATVTGAGGEFRLGEVQPGRVLVTARGDAHLPAREWVRVRPGETTRGVRLVAAPGTTLEVAVQDAAGRPVAGARVTVREGKNEGPVRVPAGGARRVEHRAGVRRGRGRNRGRNGPPLFPGQGSTLGRGETDARGQVTIGGLPGGEVWVHARHEELALVEPGELVLPEAGKASILLRMRQGGFLLVDVVDAGGQPVPDARFEVTRVAEAGGDPGASREGRCDGEGRARIGPLSAGEYSAVLLGDQRPRVRGGLSFTLAGSEPRLHDSRVRVQVREGRTAEVVLRRPVLTTVRGTVRDRSGPVEGARVALIREGEVRLPLGNGLEALTDEDGRFAIAGVPSGKYTLSWGRRSAIVPSEEEVQLQRDQPELVRHLVIPGAEVRLRVVDPDREAPVPNAEVSLSRVGAPAPGQAPGQGQQPRRRTEIRMIRITDRGSGPQRLDMSAGDRSAHTGEDGVVVIRDVPPGRYELRIRHPRFATHRERIEALDDATLDLGTRKLLAGGSVEGRIRFGDPGPMQMALVQLTTWDGKDSERTVSSNGRFRFRGLAAGRYKVRARRVGTPDAPWGPEETVEVKPGGTARTSLRLPE